MADDAYTRSYNPIWNIRDLTGLPVDDTYYAFFLENTIPYQPQNVYHTASGTPWTNPIQLSAAGTLPIDMYFDPALVYRIEIRHGNTQADALIWLIENYVPEGARNPEPGVQVNADNQITNPQFSLVNFVDGVTITLAGTYEIAPGWFLDLVGSGTITISQSTITSTDDCPTNAPYALRTSAVGWDSVTLRQVFDQNGILWNDTQINAQCTARLVSGAFPEISATLFHSPNTPITTLFSTVLTSAYVQIGADSGVDLPLWTNTDIPPDAFVELHISLPNSVVDITSIQISQGFALDFEQETIERQVDHTFHYFKPQLEFKPIPSLLCGWDFPLNPAQPLGTSVTMDLTSAYIWDQTIGQSVVGNIAIERNAVTGGIEATAGNDDEAFYYMQYLSGNEAKEILGNRLAVNIKAWKTQVGDDVTARVYLFRGSSAAVFPTLPATIGGATPLDDGGIFTKNSTAGEGQNWTEIPRSSFGSATGILSEVDTADYSTLNDVVDLKFNGWEITDDTEISDTDKFCMVVTFIVPTTATVVVVDSISLVKGDIATRPAPQTIAEVLHSCRYYYNKSFLPDTVPAQNIGIGTGEAYGVQAVIASTANTGPFVRLEPPMRSAPTVVLFNPAAANAQIRNETIGADYSASAAGGVTEAGFFCSGTSPIGLSSVAGNRIGVHWTANAQLGVV